MIRWHWTTYAAVAAVVMAGLAALPDRTIAARQAPAPAAPTLSLSSDLQGAGSTAVISLTLRAPDGVTVGKAVSEVSFPTKFLTFHNVTRGLSAEAVGGEVIVEPQPAKGDQSVLRVIVTAKAGETLPAGSLAELRFRILKEAKVDAKLVLANAASAWADAAATTAIDPVIGVNGEVKVTKTTLLPACFFYMH